MNLKKVFLTAVFFLSFTGLVYSQCEVTIDGNCRLDADIIEYQGISAPAVSPTGAARIYFDTLAGTLQCSEDGGAYTDCVGGGGSISDDVYGVSWNGDTTTGASKNALYDKIETIASGGEVNTASNTGSLGVGLFKQKTVSDLEFYKIASANNLLTAALSGTDYFLLTVNEANIDHDALTNFLTTEHFTMLDEDNMVSDSTTQAATQQSIKAYVDAQDHTDHGDGANCLAGEIPLGVDANGAVQGCYEPTEADISDLSHTTDTNANTACSGTTTYLDGEGSCDDISGVYEAADSDIAKINESENISGVWEIQDDTDLNFGNDADWSLNYDESVDNQLLIETTATSAVAITDPMLQVLVGTTPTADQQVFGVAKGTQASNTDLLTLDEDGDLTIPGSFSASNVSGTNTGDEASASTTVSGVAELATAAEMDTATDTGRVLGVNEFNDSDWGARVVFVVVLDDTTDTAVADGEGDFEWVPGDILAGYNIVDIECGVYVAGTTNTTDIQLHNVTSAADVLSTKCTIDSTETSSHTAATAAVISASEDDITSADRFRFDVDAISTTAAKGLWIELTLRKP